MVLHNVLCLLLVLTFSITEICGVEISYVKLANASREYAPGEDIKFEALVVNVTSNISIEWKLPGNTVSSANCVFNTNLTCSTDSMSTILVQNTSNVFTDITIQNFTMSVNVTLTVTPVGATPITEFVAVDLLAVSTPVTLPVTTTASQSGTSTNAQSSTTTKSTTAPIPSLTSTATPTDQCTDNRTYNINSTYSETTRTNDDLYTTEVTNILRRCVWTNTTRRYASSCYNNCTMACGNGCPMTDERRALCFENNGTCAHANYTVAKTCTGQYEGYPLCNKPICDPPCNAGQCLAPNLCTLCPFHYESGTTCRNVKLEGFTKGSLSSIGVLILILILLHLGTSYYKKKHMKEE